MRRAERGAAGWVRPWWFNAKVRLGGSMQRFGRERGDNIVGTPWHRSIRGWAPIMGQKGGQGVLRGRGRGGCVQRTSRATHVRSHGISQHGAGAGGRDWPLHACLATLTLTTQTMVQGRVKPVLHTRARPTLAHTAPQPGASGTQRGGCAGWAWPRGSGPRRARQGLARGYLVTRFGQRFGQQGGGCWHHFLARAQAAKFQGLCAVG